MPEGDTIHRIAASLAPRLTGKRLERVTTQGLIRNVAGATVTSVAAHGKHLVIELDSGAYLRAHLGMNGRFRAYDRATGEALLARMSPGRASLALTTDDGVYVWIGAPTIEVSHRRKPLHGSAVAALGPDVLADDFDPRAAATRAAEHGARMVADVLLDQRIVAGIGNIYKSESLFAAGVDPRARVAQLTPATLEAIYAAAHERMKSSVAAGSPEPRGRAGVTPQNAAARNAAPHAVYSRTGQPCPRCGTAIACYQLGDPPRWTWSCPRCQPPST
ncbi:MAG TPA: DNA-formamidopyrimidine glycosylase family protein [Kofleriaceae bacterium]|nr:DNA-formamidopyrimidine glycosylase family protein [Kofleriaceae bacterium]